MSRFIRKMNKIIDIKYHAINKSLIFASANINKMLEVSVKKSDKIIIIIEYEGKITLCN